MAIPTHSPFVIIGAGIHGLSTAYHLALQLKATGKGDGHNIIILDKSGICSGATGIACGVIRNNYFQPAMRELMAHMGIPSVTSLVAGLRIPTSMGSSSISQKLRTQGPAATTA